MEHGGKAEDKMGKDFVQVQDVQHALRLYSRPFSVPAFDKLWK